MRRAGCLLAAVLLGAAVLTSGCDREDKPSVVASAPACANFAVPAGLTPTEQSGADKTAIGAPSGGAITVTEVGFSQTDKNQYVWVGGVVSNSGSQVAYHTKVHLDITTAQGDISVFQKTKQDYLLIPVIRPGQNMAFGFQYSALPGPFDTLLRAASVKGQLQSTIWMPAEVTPDFPVVTAKVDPPGSSSAPPEHPGSASFTANFPSCKDAVAQSVRLVYRDAAGKIVGGAYSNDMINRYCRAGDFAGFVPVIGEPPPTMVEAKTEVAIYCDVNSAYT